MSEGQIEKIMKTHWRLEIAGQCAACTYGDGRGPEWPCDAVRAARIARDSRAALAQAEERTRRLVRVVEQAVDWIEMPIQAYWLKWGVDWQYGSDPMPHWTELKRVLAAAGLSSGGGGER